MKSLQNIYRQTSLLLLSLLSICSTSLAQNLEVNLYEHPNYGGHNWRLNVEDCMKGCGYANNMAMDDVSAVKVPDGYLFYLFDGPALQIVGECQSLYCVGWDDHHWDNKNNAFDIVKLPDDWDKPQVFPTGIYRFYNPYSGQYLHADGTKENDEGFIAQNQNSHRTPEKTDNDFNFLLIYDEKKQEYTILSIETGKNLRPKGSGSPLYSMKNGHALHSGNFDNTDSWSNFTFDPVGMIDLGKDQTPKRLFNIKTQGSDDYYVTIPCRERNASPVFEKGGKLTTQQWEIQLVEDLDSYNMEGILEKIEEINSSVPEEQQFTMLKFLDEETTLPRSKMSIKIPFYAINDNKYAFKKRMHTYPIYILEREEFVVRKGSNKGWTENRRNKDIEFTKGTSEEFASGTNTAFNLGASLTYTQETAATGIFFNTKTTVSVGLTMGFNKSWHSSHTQSFTTSVTEYVSPCTKAALFGLATKITVRRADKNGNAIDEAPVAQWTYYDKNSIVYDALPLHPDKCKTLSNDDYDSQLGVWKRTYEAEKNSTEQAPQMEAPTISSNDEVMKKLVGKYEFSNPSNKWHTGQVSFENGNLLWTNSAGVSWGLKKPSRIQDNSILVPTTNENPYFDKAKEFEFLLENGKVTGFKFYNAIYHRIPD